MEDNTALARDYATLSMLSAAYNFEVVLSKLADSTGISADNLVMDFGRLEVFFEPDVHVTGNEDSDQILRFNSFFTEQGQLGAEFSLRGDDGTMFSSGRRPSHHQMLTRLSGAKNSLASG